VSSENGPGPASANAAAPVAYSSGTSMPFVAANSPFFQCTLPAATIMTDSTRAGPTGPNRPSATRRPPSISERDAVMTNSRLGRNPNCSKNPAVPASPYPPSQPNSF
jgi:hypothetical protein